MVGSDTPDACANAFCSIPTRARAAFNWAAVSNVALQHKFQISCLIDRSCFKHQNCNLLNIRPYDRRPPTPRGSMSASSSARRWIGDSPEDDARRGGNRSAQGRSIHKLFQISPRRSPSSVHVSNTTRLLAKFAVSILTYDTSTIDHAW